MKPMKPNLKQHVEEPQIEAAGKCMRLLEQFKNPHDVQIVLTMMVIYAGKRFGLDPRVILRVMLQNLRLFGRWDILEWMLNGMHHFVAEGRLSVARALELPAVFRQRPRALTLDS